MKVVMMVMMMMMTMMIMMMMMMLMTITCILIKTWLRGGRGAYRREGRGRGDSAKERNLNSMKNFRIRIKS